MSGKASTIADKQQQIVTIGRGATRLKRFNAKYQPDLYSAESILDLQCKGWRSDVYLHFVMPPEITTMESGEIGYIFTCKSDPKKSISRARSDDSTSNLTRHAKSCGDSPSAASTALSNFDVGRFRYLVAAWSARHARPFAIIEDEELRDILIMLHSTIQIHSRQTVARDISDMYEQSRNVIARHLQSVKQRLHVTLDGWTSPNVFSFLGVTVRYFDKGDTGAFVLDFVKMSGSHTGEHLARELEKLLKSFGIENKILTIVCDNASNNDTMIESINLEGFRGAESRVRCFPHILNLSVKAILSPFSNKLGDETQPVPMPVSRRTHDTAKPRRVVPSRVHRKTVIASDSDSDSDSNSWLSDGGDDDINNLDQDDDVIRAAEEAQQEDLDEAAKSAELEVNVTDDEWKTASTALSKLTKLAFKINNSPVLIDELEALCLAADIKPLRMIKPVDTRWNSKSHMISRAIYLKRAIEDICSQRSLVSRYGTGQLMLTPEEWTIIEELSPLLGAFHDISLEMQSAVVPLISSVIPRIDDLVQVIDNFKDDDTKHPAVRSAAIRGLALLNKYYQKSDESFVYRIAIALDPRYKLRYLSNQEWPARWINTVKNITRLVYEEDYPSLTAVDLPASPKKLPAPSGDWPSLLRRKVAKTVSREHDELTAFWASPCEPHDVDPLQYWQGVLLGRPENRLARMAVDYLSAPAASVDAERAFSRGALTVTHRRHTLSDTSTRNSIVLGTWLRDTNLVPKDELIKLFRGKPFRSQTVLTCDSVQADDSDGSSF